MAMQVGKTNHDYIRDMKNAYDRFIRLASKLSLSRFHAAHLLQANSAYNLFVKELHEKKGDPS